MKQILFLPRVIIAIFVLMCLSGSALSQEEVLTAHGLRWSADGRWIGVGSSDGVWIFDADDLAAEPYHYGSGPAYVAAFNPVRVEVAFSSGETQVQVVEIETGSAIFTADTPPDDYYAVFYDIGYSDDGSTLTVLNTSLTYLLDATTGDKIQVYANPEAAPDFSITAWATTFAYDTEGDAILTGHWGTSLFSHSLSSPKTVEKHALFTETSDVMLEQIGLIPETRDLVVMGGRTLSIYNLETKEQTPLDAFGDVLVNGFTLSADGTILAVGADASWYLYDVTTDTITAEHVSDFTDPANTGNLLYALAFSPDTDRLATLQADGRVVIWDTASGEQLGTLGNFTYAFSHKWG